MLGNRIPSDVVLVVVLGLVLVFGLVLVLVQTVCPSDLEKMDFSRRQLLPRGQDNSFQHRP